VICISVLTKVATKHLTYPYSESDLRAGGEERVFAAESGVYFEFGAEGVSFGLDY
jgi:hypothetical protein